MHDIIIKSKAKRNFQKNRLNIPKIKCTKDAFIRNTIVLQSPYQDKKTNHKRNASFLLLHLLILVVSDQCHK